MVDGWMGDDWFHYGAFRLANIAWLGGQTGYKSGGPLPPTGGWDDYDNFRTGSAGDWADLVAVFRRGLAFATVVAVAAVVVTLREVPREDSDYFATRTEAEFELALR